MTFSRLTSVSPYAEKQIGVFTTALSCPEELLFTDCSGFVQNIYFKTMTSWLPFSNLSKQTSAAKRKTEN